MYNLGEQGNRELQDILINAVNETEYYRDLLSVHKGHINIYGLADFPLLTQQAVQRERSRFLCGRYQRYPDIEHLLLKRSFGISGIPLEFYWDSRDDVRSQAFLWEYRKERFNITEKEKCCIFCTAEYAGNKLMHDIPKRLSRDGKHLSFSMKDLSLERLKLCLDVILEFNPTWMCIPPSVAMMLAENMLERRLLPPSNLRYIELYGEMLDMQMEARIRDVFHVKTGNVYVTQAAGAVAASCEYGHLHVFPKNVVVEVISENKSVLDEEGDIYITSLQNTAMPLIRFKTGDCGLLQSIPCPCGQRSPVLHLTRGRKCNYITTTFGRRISSFMLRSQMEDTNEEIARCLAYIHFRQNGYGCIDAIMSVKPAFSGWEKEVIRIFQRKIQDTELEQMKWNFCFSDDVTQMELFPFFESWEGENDAK